MSQLAGEPDRASVQDLAPQPRVLRASPLVPLSMPADMSIVLMARDAVPSSPCEWVLGTLSLEKVR